MEEETEEKIEQNVINSIGSNEEITEPHVKQIISAFGGIKFYKEDIDKFKQLEKTFIEISKLEDGESILKNLTSDIREVVTSGASIQIANGTVSIAQVATIVIGMAEKTYKEYKEIEVNKAQKNLNEQKDEMKTQINEKTNVNVNAFENIEEYEKFIGNLEQFFEGIGVELTEEDKEIFQEEMKELYKLGKEKGKDGEPKDKEAAEAIEMLEKANKTRNLEDMLAAAKKLREYYDSRIQALYDTMDEKAKSGDISSLSVSERLKYEETIARVETLQCMRKIYEKAVAVLERGEYCDPSVLFGETAENISSFISDSKKIEEYKSKKNTNNPEFAQLIQKRNKFLHNQEIQYIDREIERINKRIDVCLRAFELSKNLEDRITLKNRLDKWVGEKCVLMSKKEKLQGLDEDKTPFELVDFEVESSRKTVRKYRGNVDFSRTDEARDYARSINDLYILQGGNISLIEQQMSFLGKREDILSPKNVSQIAAETIVGKYVDKYKEIGKIFQNAKDEKEKIKAFKQINIAKSVLIRELEGINISRQYKEDILAHFEIQEDVIDPEEYQLYMWKASVEDLRERGKDTSMIEEIVSRLEKNKDVFDEIIEDVFADKGKQKARKELFEALNNVKIKKKATKEWLKNASTEEDIMKFFLDGFDNEFGQNPKFSGDVREQFEEILRNVYARRGKDGILTLLENHKAASQKYRHAQSVLHTKAVIDKHFTKLKDDELVSFEPIEEIDGDNSSRWPDFLLDNDNEKYLSIMLSLRKKLVSESTISTTLIQMNPEAARNAYALYELISNRKQLQNPDVGEQEKQEIRARNKTIIEMMFKQYQKKILARNERYQYELEEHPEKAETLLKSKKECMDALNRAASQRVSFDIEKSPLRMPNEEAINALYKEKQRKLTNIDSEHKISDMLGNDPTKRYAVPKRKKDKKEEHNGKDGVSLEEVRTKTKKTKVSDINHQLEEVKDIYVETSEKDTKMLGQNPETRENDGESTR